tara:strand:- start:320 stop:703 length:384 start_codon:yes stop_codon:yes gene_type:complete
MADVVTSRTLFDGDKKVVINLTNISDGSGEAAVKKVDISSLTPVGTHFSIEKIQYSVYIGSVTLLFDASTDDTAITLSGSGTKDYTQIGGITDPKSSGYTGDIMLTTDAFGATSTYDLTITLKKHGI